MIEKPTYDELEKRVLELADKANALQKRTSVLEGLYQSAPFLNNSIEIGRSALSGRRSHSRCAFK